MKGKALIVVAAVAVCLALQIYLQSGNNIHQLRRWIGVDRNGSPTNSTSTSTAAPTTTPSTAASTTTPSTAKTITTHSITAALRPSGGRGSPLSLNNAEMAAALRGISVTPRDPSMCNNLLTCILVFVERLIRLPRTQFEFDGALVIALGDGQVFHITYPMHFGPPATSIIDGVMEGARSVTRPTVFHVGCADGDMFHLVFPDCPSKPIDPKHNPHVLSEDFPFVFFLAPSVTYSEGGRVVANSIPIPDAHTIGGGESKSAKCESRSPATEEEIASRPNSTIFFGSTTGYTRDFGRGYTYSVADRFQLVDHLLGSNISNSFFTRLVQGINLPRGYLRGGAAWQTWKSKARYVLDVDGNSNAWGALNWKLCSGGPVIKVNSSTRWVQWYYHHLEHGVNVHMVDVLRQDVEEEVRRVLNDIPYATKLANGAAAFCCKYLRGEVQKRQLLTTVATIWESLPELKARDWRIKSPPSDHLRPLISPYVRYGPMKRIRQALMADSNTTSSQHNSINSTIPTSLLNLAKLIDIRDVCVFGTMYPALLPKQFWVDHFNKPKFKPVAEGSLGGGPCDLVVLLEDALGKVTDGALNDVVSREYHVIVSLGVSTRNATALRRRKSEVVVGEWPSVSGVVTQIQSLLKYPDNYHPEPHFPCP